MDTDELELGEGEIDDSLLKEGFILEEDDELPIDLDDFENEEDDNGDAVKKPINDEEDEDEGDYDSYDDPVADF